MKKITLIAFSLFVTGFTFGQTTFKDSHESTPIIFSQENRPQEACSQSVESNALENGGLFGAQRLAIDIDVPANEIFSIETIIPVMIGEGTSFEIIIWDDAGGIPGSLELFNPDVTVTGDVITGTNFGFNFHAMTLTLDTPLELLGGVSGEKFWMEILTNAAGWESSTLASTGDPGAFANDSSGGEWASNSSGADYVYEILGDCSSLGVNQNALSQVSIFPNPTSDILNLKTPSNVEVNSVALFDILGKRVNINYSNETINMSALSQGIYILKVETSAGSLTQKIVKQ